MLPNDGMLVFAEALLHVVVSSLLTVVSIVFHVGLITSPGSVSGVILIQIASFTRHWHQFGSNSLMFDGAVFPLNLMV